MHAKTDSDVTSLSAASPNRSPPRRPVYYVQSPSRDSHDGEKTTTSFHSTPVLSPMGSPPHAHSSVGHHSRESSSTRFSGSFKPNNGSRKISPNDAGSGGGGKGGQKKQPWKECDVIEEENLVDDEESQKPLSRRCYVLAFLLGFFVLFSFFALILWGAARPQKPKITVKVLLEQPYFFWSFDYLYIILAQFVWDLDKFCTPFQLNLSVVYHTIFAEISGFPLNFIQF